MTSWLISAHHHFGSRFIIDSLHKHGFCYSYAEVVGFKRNAAKVQGTDLPRLNDFPRFV